MTIDMHAHWSPPELIDIYRARTEPPMIITDDDGNDMIRTRKGEQAFGVMFDDLETRLAEMDEHGVTTGVLSLSQVKELYTGAFETWGRGTWRLRVAPARPRHRPPRSGHRRRGGRPGPAVGQVGRIPARGSRDDDLHAVNTADGSEKWRFDTGADVESAPVVDAAHEQAHLRARAHRGRLAPSCV